MTDNRFTAWEWALLSLTLVWLHGYVVGMDTERRDWTPS